MQGGVTVCVGFATLGFGVRIRDGIVIVIIIVIEYLYSATQKQRRFLPGPVSSLVKREVFRCLWNWLKEIEKRSVLRDCGNQFQLLGPTIAKLLDWAVEVRTRGTTK